YGRRQAALGPGNPGLVQVSQVSSDDIRSRIKTFRSAPRRLRRRISRAVAQKQKQREREITQHFPKHDLSPPVRSPFGTVMKSSLRRQFPRVAGLSLVLWFCATRSTLFFLSLFLSLSLSLSVPSL